MKVRHAIMLRRTGNTITTETFYAEQNLARERLGRSTKDMVRWWCRVLRTDFDRLSQGDWLNLQHEMTCFVVDGLTRVQAIEKKQRHMVPMYSGNDFLSQDTVRAMLARSQEIIEKVHRRMRVTPPEPTGFTPELSYHDGSGQWVERWLSRNPVDTFTGVIFELLKQYGHLMKQCPEHAHTHCQRWFLSERETQVFCSKECQSRVATAKYRRAHGLITGRPPGRPRKTYSPGRKHTPKKGGKHGTAR